MLVVTNSWSALRAFTRRGGTHSGRGRDTRGTGAGPERDTSRQQKTLIRTYAPLVQVRLRGAREPRAEGVHRPSAKQAQIFPYLFAPSPRTLEGRSGNDSRSNPAEGLPRGAPSPIHDAPSH